MSSLSVELGRLNSDPCTCFSGFISPVPPLPRLLLETLEPSFWYVSKGSLQLEEI